MKNIKQLLSTLAQTCFHIHLSPIRLITVCRNSSVWNEAWQKVSKPHNFSRLGCYSSDIRKLVDLGIPSAASQEIEWVPEFRFSFLGRTLLSNPRIIWMSTEALNCDNA